MPLQLRARRVALGVALLASATAVATLAAVTPPRVSFTDTTLDNGLRVVIAEDHAAPVFSIAVMYNVGSRNERPGRTGFAHLFEHMMFKGSENVGPGEHFYTVFVNGGTMNGTTNKERTVYYETMPANQLDAALFLEADRMRSLAITKENLDNQRNAVQEERRQSYDNQPYGTSDLAMDDLAFDNPAYKHSVIGSMDDLNAASVDDVAAFFKTYYAPNNAVVAITGDVAATETLAKVRQYFGRIPRQAAPPPVDVSQSPQTAERRLTISDPLARLPRLNVAYRIPSSVSADDEAIDVLRSALGVGRTSRLYEALVREQQLAVNVNAFAGASRGPRLLEIEVTPAAGKSIADVEAAVYAEVERLSTVPLADWELEKAQNAAKRQLVNLLDNSLRRAQTLATYALFYGDPGVINSRYEEIAQVTPADVQRLARTYLTASNRTVVVTEPGAAAGGRR
jgi:zinc protease